MTAPTSTFLPAGFSFLPVGQLVIAEWNPRIIRSSEFVKLLKSIEDDPAFLIERPPLVADGPVHKAGRIVYAGNRRCQAISHLYESGWQPPAELQQQGWLHGMIPASVRDVPKHVAQKRALQDNNHEGEWNEDQLSELLNELGDNEIDLNTLGFDDKELKLLLEGSGMAEPSGQDLVGKNESYQQRFELVIECAGESQLHVLYDEMTNKGFKCRTLML